MQTVYNDSQSINFDEISLIPIEDILRYLWVWYVKKWDTLKLCENNVITDWWVAHKWKNIVTDFSEKWRAQWWPFSFVKSYHKLDDKETFKFFKEYKYWIQNFERVLVEATERKIETEKDQVKRQESVAKMIDVYKSIESNIDELTSYLANRKIDFTKVPESIKNDLKCSTIHFDNLWYKDKVFIPMKDIEKNESGELVSRIVWIKARSIDPLTNPKFKSISIRNSYIWMFFADEVLKVSKGKLVFLCEWETDALALFSAWFKNVIWNLWGVWYVNKKFNDVFNKFDNIVIAYDNDEAGRNWIKKVIETVWFENNYYVIDFEKVRKNLKVINKEISDEKLSWKLDINDILKFCNGNTDNFKDIIQKSAKLYNKDKLLKEVLKKKQSSLVSVKKT